jgi:DNA mismatch endonuclease (patch repair protein)
MATQRRRDTEPELAYRRALFILGLRFRVDYRIATLRRRADIVFTRWKVVVFVDGCFWHSCPLHATIPKGNREWWIAKLETNVARDRSTDAQLQAMGWTVIRLWEHEPPDVGVPRILKALHAAGRPESV